MTTTYRGPVITAAITKRRRFYDSWSRRTRWLLALALMIGFLCSGLAVAVPLALFLDYTDAQGDAPATAEEAADVYLGRLDQDEKIGLSRVLAVDERGDLLRQWQELRDRIEHTNPPPDKLAWSTFDVRGQGDEADVVVPVRAQWRQDRGITMVGAEHPWCFRVHREDGGWRITAVEPFPWCGGHVRQDACL